MGAAATAAGFIGYALAAAGTIAFPPTLAGAIPAADHNRFLGVWFAHCTSYLVGLTGAGVLCYRVWSARGRPAVISLLPKNRRAWWRVLALAAVVGCIVWMRFLRR